MTKAEIEARLQAAGAFYLSDADDLHEIWGTTWGFVVWVPMAGPFGSLDEETFLKIEFDILRSKP